MKQNNFLLQVAVKFFLCYDVRMKKVTSLALKEKRIALEEKIVQGAERALKEYRQVFERLAEYDRT